MPKAFATFSNTRRNGVRAKPILAASSRQCHHTHATLSTTKPRGAHRESHSDPEEHCDVHIVPLGSELGDTGFAALVQATIKAQLKPGLQTSPFTLPVSGDKSPHTDRWWQCKAQQYKTASGLLWCPWATSRLPLRSPSPGRHLPALSHCCVQIAFAPLDPGRKPCHPAGLPPSSQQGPQALVVVGCRDSQDDSTPTHTPNITTHLQATCQALAVMHHTHSQCSWQPGTHWQPCPGQATASRSSSGTQSKVGSQVESCIRTGLRSGP